MAKSPEVKAAYAKYLKASDAAWADFTAGKISIEEKRRREAQADAAYRRVLNASRVRGDRELGGLMDDIAKKGKRPFKNGQRVYMTSHTGEKFWYVISNPQAQMLRLHGADHPHVYIEPEGRPGTGGWYPLAALHFDKKSGLRGISDDAAALEQRAAGAAAGLYARTRAQATDLWRAHPGMVLAGAGALVLLGVSWWQRRQIAAGASAAADVISKGASMAWDAAATAAFRAALAIDRSSNASDYTDLILQVAREKNLSPWIIYGIGWQETRWGKGWGYKDDAGDWTMRTGRWLNEPNVRQVDTAPAGWSYPKRSSDDPQGRWKKGDVIPGPYAIPADGAGWGRGLMQIDYNNARGINYHDALTAIRAGADHFIQDRATLAGQLPAYSPDQLDRATMVAYNHGTAGFMHNANNGLDWDAGTTGGAYSQEIIDQISKVGGPKLAA